MLDVIATHEDLVTASTGVTVIDEGNDMSTLLRITFPDGTRFLNMGDFTRDSINSLTARIASSELKCKFMEVPHHGYELLTPENCGVFRPTYVLWPNFDPTNFTDWKADTASTIKSRLTSKGANYFYYAGTKTTKLTIRNGSVTVNQTDPVY